MRGRWGGRRGSGSFKFFINKFWDRINLSDYKSVTTKSDFTDDTKTIEDVDYTEMSGIWDINTTAQFSKKPAAVAFNDVSFGSQIFGHTGPNLTQATSAMLGTDSPQPITVTNGIQYWVVPATGTYRILAHGAKGGSASHSYGGQGASIQGDFTLSQGETIMILVGQQPDPADYSDFDSPGGGGTFVVKGTNPSSATTSDILVIAGGGGGSDANSYGTPSASQGVGVTTTDGGSALPSAKSSGFGTNGAGGNNSINQTVQGGAGFDGDSVISQPGTTTHIAAKSFKNGGVGGFASYGSPGGYGGFGGGGGCGRNGAFGAMGGGGGYSGGASGYNSYAGGGGGSYNNGTNQVNTAGGSPFTGNGRVYVTKIG